MTAIFEKIGMPYFAWKKSVSHKNLIEEHIKKTETQKNETDDKSRLTP